MLPFYGHACFLQIIAFLFSSIYASDINLPAYFHAGLALFHCFIHHCDFTIQLRKRRSVHYSLLGIGQQHD